MISYRVSEGLLNAVGFISNKSHHKSRVIVGNVDSVSLLFAFGPWTSLCDLFCHDTIVNGVPESKQVRPNST